jgi:aminobutyraldehyde dehydrogenase
MTQTVQSSSAQVRRGDGSALVCTAELPPRGHFIANEFVAGGAGGSIDVVNPADGSVLTTVIEGTADDVDKAVRAALGAKADWARLVPKQRAEILHKIADRLAENADVLARLESANTGKPLMVSQDDVSGSIDTFRFMAGAARAITSQAAADYAEGHLSVILREPLGVVGVVTPWNYPLLMAVWKIAPILAAGNTMVIKPSEQTPLTTLKFAQLVADLLPAGVLTSSRATVPSSATGCPGIPRST